MGSFNIIDVVKSSVMMQDGPKWPTYDNRTLNRTQFITASEAETCLRQLSFKKHHEREIMASGVQDWDELTDEQFKQKLDEIGPDHRFGFFERGHATEAWIVDNIKFMEEDHEEFTLLGEDQVSFYSTRDKVAGTPDGIRVDHNEQCMNLLEFKSSTNVMTAPRNSHVTQVLVNMGLIHHLIEVKGADYLSEHLGFTVYNKWSSGVLLYVNAHNWMNMQQFNIPWDEGEAYREVARRASHLFINKSGDLAKPRDLPPEGLDKGQCIFCPFKKECLKIQETTKDKKNVARFQDMLLKAMGNGKLPELPAFKSDQPKSDILRAIENYDMWRGKEKEAKERKEQLNKILTDWLETQSNKKFTFEDDGKLYSVALSVYERAGSWDKEKLEALLENFNEDPKDYRKPNSEVKSLNVKFEQLKEAC